MGDCSPENQDTAIVFAESSAWRRDGVKQTGYVWPHAARGRTGSGGYSRYIASHAAALPPFFGPPAAAARALIADTRR
jgi:hypothetical protein